MILPMAAKLRLISNYPGVPASHRGKRTKCSSRRLNVVGTKRLFNARYLRLVPGTAMFLWYRLRTCYSVQCPGRNSSKVTGYPGTHPGYPSTGYPAVGESVQFRKLSAKRNWTRTLFVRGFLGYAKEIGGPTEISTLVPADFETHAVCCC